MSETLVAGLLGGGLAAVITLFGVLATNRSRLAEDNVIKQRAEWRDAVRSLIAQAVVVDDEKEARRIWCELALRMNPDDPTKDDVELVSLVKDLQSDAGRSKQVRERIVLLASRILKHDWTRAKWEAQGWFWEDEPQQDRTPFRRISASPLRPQESGITDEPR